MLLPYSECFQSPNNTVHGLPTHRKLLADTLASGDVELSLKCSFIMAHPIASDQLRDNANTPNRTGVDLTVKCLLTSPFINNAVKNK